MAARVTWTLCLVAAAAMAGALAVDIANSTVDAFSVDHMTTDTRTR
jgi:hypothetical protein